MTAPITGQSHQYIPWTPSLLSAEMAETIQTLEVARNSAPGTLWERVAEGADKFNILMFLPNVIKADHAARQYRDALGVPRRPMLARYRWAVRSGVIRAGVRIK